MAHGMSGEDKIVLDIVSVGAVVGAGDALHGGVEVGAELLGLGALDTSGGQLALRLARVLENSTVGVASLSRELRDVLANVRWKAGR